MLCIRLVGRSFGIRFLGRRRRGRLRNRFEGERNVCGLRDIELMHSEALRCFRSPMYGPSVSSFRALISWSLADARDRDSY
jgi:hypothetical protein